MSLRVNDTGHHVPSLWATILGIIIALAIELPKELFQNSLLTKLFKGGMIIIVELLFPIFALHRAYKKWPIEKTLAKESLLTGLLGGVCLIGIIAFWPFHRPLILNSMISTSFVAIYIQCLLWNDHLRDKV